MSIICASAQFVWCGSTVASTRRCGWRSSPSRPRWLLGAGVAEVGQARRSQQRPAEGVTTSERERIKDLEREVRELRRANDILRTASAFFAQAELDRKLKS